MENLFKLIDLKQIVRPKNKLEKTVLSTVHILLESPIFLVEITNLKNYGWDVQSIVLE